MRAKSHDQRKGQWLINHIRNGIDYKKIKAESLDDMMNYEKRMIELRLWNMENGEFDKIMERYND